jgi:hypothetical protein
MRNVLIAGVYLCLAGLVQAQSTLARKFWDDSYTALAERNRLFVPNPFLTKMVAAEQMGRDLVSPTTRSES